MTRVSLDTGAAPSARYELDCLHGGDQRCYNGLTELACQPGLRGVYVFAVCGVRPPPWPDGLLGFMRLRATRHDCRRHVLNARNEGVPGSSPGVGFRLLCRGFFCAGNVERPPPGTKRVHLPTLSRLVKWSSPREALAEVQVFRPFPPTSGARWLSRECPRDDARGRASLGAESGVVGDRRGGGVPKAVQTRGRGQSRQARRNVTPDLPSLVGYGAPAQRVVATATPGFPRKIPGGAIAPCD